MPVRMRTYVREFRIDIERWRGVVKKTVCEYITRGVTTLTISTDFDSVSRSLKGRSIRKYFVNLDKFFFGEYLCVCVISRF